MLPASVEGSCESDRALSTVDKGLGGLSSVSEEVEEDMKGPSQALVEGRLRNSEVFSDVASHLPLLTALKSDILGLINPFPSLFPDIPTCAADPFDS